jgi:hypothetical protein
VFSINFGKTFFSQLANYLLHRCLHSIKNNIQSIETMPSIVKRLIILDLNGLLIHRLHKHEYVRCKTLLKQQYNLGTLDPAEIIGNFAVWFRPDVKQFLSWLIDHFHVAIWSSVLKHNIEPVVETLLPSSHERDRLLFWWNQENCLIEEDPTETNMKKAKSFYKCLSSVWDTVELNERWLINQPDDVEMSNHTLLIDDSVLKARDNPVNTAIHPRSWKLFELYDDYQQIRIFKDDTLKANGTLRLWLEELLKWKGNVADFVKDHPYHDANLEEEKVMDDPWATEWTQ